MASISKRSELPDIQAIKTAAQAHLLAIPGVHAVGCGAKIVGGKRGSEPAITVFLLRKRALSEIPLDEVIPPEIEGVKTDVVEMPIPRMSAGGPKDGSTARPTPGGVCIQAGGSPEWGTLGFFALTSDATPKVVAVTCQHVVAAPQGANHTDLAIVGPTGGSASGASFSVGVNNTPGTTIVLKFGIKSTSAAPPTIVGNAYYKTTDADTAATIATNLTTAIMAMDNSDINAAPGATPDVVQVSITPASNIQLLQCSAYDPVIANPGCQLVATVSYDPATLTSTVVLSGTVDRPYGIYTSWNADGNAFTGGAFTAAVQGATLQNTASAIVASITAAAAAGVTASLTDTGFTLSRVAEADCFITRDLRVGQPNDSFSSKCSLCCSNEIGQVIAANMALDVALIQLVKRAQYLNEAKLIGPVRGTHEITAAEAQAGYAVQKYGAATTQTNGTVQYSGVSGYATNSAGDWVVFYRYYQNALVVPWTDPSNPFSSQGDSGAAVLNNAGEIVGILFAGQNQSLITPIQAVLTQMSITVATATETGQTQTVTDAQGVTAMSVVQEGLIDKTLRQAHSDIIATPAGRSLADAVQRHAGEVQNLVNGNRRVATVWHRSGGPIILQTLLQMIQSPDKHLPQAINGKPLTKCLADLQASLMRYGSVELASDIVNFGPRLLELAGLSYSQLLLALKRQEAV
jgi:hypothetical protein